MLWIFLSVRRSDSLAGDAMGGRSMQDKQIPTVHCSGQPNHLPKTAGELKASLYDNHPWYYSHNDDGDLQMSLSLCVQVCVCECVCASAVACLPSREGHYYSGHSSGGGAPTAAN